ncbi:MAG TPA: DNA polymerase/3'-5' exonuclease PolX [Bacilli bacterium]|nr:DNA polymerase/3'-5' exonuclease PolX [Bacilli bacterium]
MNKKDVIKVLETIAVYMEIKGENPFKISAYRKAATALEQDERTLDEISDPTKLKGIGKGTGEVILELKEHGTSSLLTELQDELPEGLISLLKIPGLGGKKIGKLYQELQIDDMESLKQACIEKKVQKIAGFGKKSEENILAAIEEVGVRPERLSLAFVLSIAEQIEQQLSQMKAVEEFSRAGSLRRLRETVKDLDFIIATSEPDVVREQLLALENVSSIIANGPTKVSVELAYSYPINVDFRLVEKASFATTLHHFTGSKEHNVKMRQLAKERGEKISEYGVENVKTGELKTFTSEATFFNHFGLHYIPPEAREDQGEVELFREAEPLVELADIKSDLHMHTTWSDGAYSIADMAEAAIKRGYSHIVITDHSQFLRVANGMTEKRLREQMEEIQTLNEQYTDFKIYTGIEMDILPDGTLDYADALLSELDFVIASIHSSFQQDEETIMKRLETALRNKHVDLIAHPTGRLIGRRDGYKVNVERLIELAAETKTALELNANPHRLDLSPHWLKKAQQAGVPIAINTDAHRFETLHHMEIGVGVARKGLIRKETVINTWSKEKFEQFLQRYE